MHSGQESGSPIHAFAKWIEKYPVYEIRVVTPPANCCTKVDGNRLA